MSYNRVYCSAKDQKEMRDNIDHNSKILSKNTERIDNLKKELLVLNEQRMQVLENATANNSRVIENYTANFNSKISKIKAEGESQLAAGFDSAIAKLNGLENEITNISYQTAKSASDIKSISQSFDSAMQSIVSRMTSSSQKVNAYIGEIDKQLDDLSTLNPQMLGYESEYKKLIYTRNNISANYNAGVYDAALADAQSALIDSSTLLLNCVSTNNYFNTEYNKIMDELDALRMEFSKYEDGKNLVLRINNDENNESAFNINYLTDGKFGGFVNQFKEFYNVVAERKITINDLDNIKANAKQFKQGLDGYINQAKDSLAYVFAVKQLAINAFKKLDDNAWNLVDSGYAEKNMLRPYLSVYEDGFGNRINIICQKDEKSQGTVYYAKAFSKDGSESNDETLELLIRNLVSGEGIKTTAVYDTSSCDKTKTADSFVEHVVNRTNDTEENTYRYY